MLHLLHSTMWSTRRNTHSALEWARGRDQWEHQGQRHHEGTPQARAQEAIIPFRTRRRRSEDRCRPSRRASPTRQDLLPHAAAVATARQKPPPPPPQFLRQEEKEGTQRQHNQKQHQQQQEHHQQQQ